MRRSTAALAIFFSALGLTVVLRSQTQVTNPAASLQGKTLAVAENSLNVTGAWQFNRGASAPFLVVPGAAKVANLDVDFLDGHPSSYYRDLTNINAGSLGVTRGGTGAATFTAHGPLLGAGTSAVVASGPGTAGQVYTSNGAGADPSFQPAATTAQVWTLLKANAGTDTNAGAATIDSIAISGLGPRDSILVYWDLFSATTNTSNLHLYSVTDSTALTNKSGINANASFVGDVRLNQDQSLATSIFYYNNSYESGGGGGRAGALLTGLSSYQGAWTLGLRHEGVSAGGTLRFRWAVYKIAGT